METNPSLRSQNKPYRGLSFTKILFTIIFIGSLGLNGYLLYFQKDKMKYEVAKAPVVTREITRRANAEPAAAKTIAISETAALKSDSANQVSVKQASLPTSLSLNGKEVHFLRFKVENSLNYSVCKALPGKDCDKMSAYVSRILSWFLDMKTSMRAGDSLSMIYEVLPTEDRYKILKLTYVSGYASKTYEVNYYKSQDMKYGSYYSSDGVEIAPRIEDNQTPIRDYIEITSLPGEFREGKVRGHSGTDFKADIGTAVHATFDGTVSRVNWNFKMNGDCVEIEHPQKGIKTLYLHLNKVLVKRGDVVKQGQQIAESGNTGRSFAPHLHYEIQGLDDKKVIHSPFKSKFHQTYFREIPKENKEDYEKTVYNYDSMLQKS